MIKIINADSFKEVKNIEENSIDLIFTSPPYANMKKYENFEGIHPDKYVDWIFPLIKDSYRILKTSGNLIININDKIENKFRHPYVFDLVSKICRETEFKLFERLFWNKGKYLPNKKRFGDKVEYILWFSKNKKFTFNIDKMRLPYNEISIKRMKNPIKKRFSRTEGENLEYKNWRPNPLGALPSTLINIGSESKKISDNHIAVFPEKLVDYFIKGASNEGDTILDPFAGTFTTGVVCKKLNRNFIGIELSKDYCNQGKIRIENEKINNI